MEPRISYITLGVSNLHKSTAFYQQGLGFPTNMTPNGGIVVFATSGTRLSLYPFAKLAEDAGLPMEENKSKKTLFPGFTLGHCVRNRADVDAVLSQAGKAGGKIVKPAINTFWGGYSGYFADPDGYLWEVAFAEVWKFDSDGNLLMGS